ncbi:hypothetical protein FRC02_010844 [Tulasnella sp. 418]|nr:hypothetical protein FRC02_010844 [Tulasnella sp. 418]
MMNGRSSSSQSHPSPLMPIPTVIDSGNPDGDDNSPDGVSPTQQTTHEDPSIQLNSSIISGGEEPVSGGSSFLSGASSDQGSAGNVVIPDMTTSHNTVDPRADNTHTEDFERYCFLAQEAWSRFDQHSDPMDINDAIQSYQAALDLPHSQASRRVDALDKAAACLLARYQNHHSLEDLERAIRRYKEVLLYRPSGDHDRGGTLSGLAKCLNLQYMELGSMSRLEEAILYYREAILHCSSVDEKQFGLLNNLACGLLNRYEQQGDVEDLDEVISCFRSALQLCPAGHPKRSRVLTNLAAALLNRYEVLGAMQYLEEAIEHLKVAAQLYAVEGADPSSPLNNLGNCLVTRYEKLGFLDDFTQAIRSYRSAIAVCSTGHPNRSLSLKNLASCLVTRFEQQGDIQDLEEAICLHQEALLLRPIGHPKRSMSLSSLSSCLHTRYNQLGAAEDLVNSVKYQRQALELRPVGHSSRSMSLNNLGTCLLTQYIQGGNILDLDEATWCHRDALDLCPPGHTDRFMSLTNLSTCLGVFYHQLDQFESLQEAIKLQREALLLCPVGHPSRWGVLDSLAVLLRDQYKGHIRLSNAESNAHDLADENLEEAVQYSREAVFACPPKSIRYIFVLNNLGSCLRSRYESGGNVEDLEEAIQYFRSALSLQSSQKSEHSPEYPILLRNIGTSLLTLYKHDGCNETQYLDEAIQCLNDVIHLGAPSNHPLLASTWAVLASIYADKPQLLTPTDDIKDFTDLFQKAVNHPTTSPRDRFRLSLAWIEKQHGASGLKAYQKCLELSDRLVLVRPSITSRHQFLSSVSSLLVTEAVASALIAGEVERAVEFLDQGKSLLLSQVGRYRTSIDELKEVNPGLAEEFTRISEQLELSTISDITFSIPSSSMKHHASKYWNMAESWNVTVEKIRQLHGFSGFLRAPEFSILRQAAKIGPVIIVNAHPYHTGAIIVWETQEPIHVALPNVTPTQISKYFALFRRSIEKITVGGAKAGKSARSCILGILRALWEDIVQPIVDMLQSSNTQPGSRIWWCLTGDLAMLPIHAAGPYRSTQPNLVDIYISSYTPTLSALLKSIRRHSNGHNRGNVIPRLLLVSQKATPGQESIPSVDEEASRIRSIVPIVDELRDEAGTFEAVLAGLKTHAWVHISCHGSQKITKPFNSCFYLYDRPLNLLNIIQARLPDAQYAFLAACHSAAGDINRPNETIHLAAALQFSGFNTVIGTMYAMADNDGPIIAQEVYKYMFRKVGNPDLSLSESVNCTEAAVALNIATKALRDSKVPLERWINFVHIGR